MEFKTDGVVENKLPGFPLGAGSAQQAVIAQIKAENNLQNYTNKTLGGKGKSHRRSSHRRSSHKRKSHKRKSHKIKSHKIKSHKRSSHKRKSHKRKSHKKRSLLPKKFYGGLEAGKEVVVPQFGASNNSGAINPNTMSAGFNGLLMQSVQGAKYDEEMNK